MTAQYRELKNSYLYLEIECAGLIVHVKHFNTYETLADQIAEADYRLKLTNRNTGFAQLALAFNEWPTRVPDRSYVILFYQDGQNKSTVGNIFFILPAHEDEKNMANCTIEDVIAAYPPPDEGSEPKLGSSR